jgi:hypothetical protein
MYRDYLRTQAWKNMRRWVLERDDDACTRCGTTVNLEVHHLSYERLGRESPDDLLTLCATCHEETHAPERIAREESRRQRKRESAPPPLTFCAAMLYGLADVLRKAEPRDGTPPSEDELSARLDLCVACGEATLDCPYQDGGTCIPRQTVSWVRDWCDLDLFGIDFHDTHIGWHKTVRKQACVSLPDGTIKVASDMWARPMALDVGRLNDEEGAA